MATNAGGPHTLKYGVTVNHVLGVEAVLADGSIVQIRAATTIPAATISWACWSAAKARWASSRKFGFASRPIRKTTARSGRSSTRVEDATNTVSQIIAAGIIPAALELMDQGILEAVEDGVSFRLSARRRRGADHRGRRPRRWVSTPARADHRRSARRTAPAKCCRPQSASERELLWKCRKMAVGAIGRLSPS